MDFLAGETIVIDKPLGWTSFDVVNKIRGLLRQSLGVKKIKVGHAGTLDPLATGIVIVCTGKATKGIDALMNHDKEYVATIRLGATTPSFDLEEPIDATFPTEHITEELIRRVIAEQFTGEIEQVPPIFSAIQVNGKRAYEHARKGEQVELKPRQIRINSIRIEDISMPDVRLRISCSKGTYIRAIARDLGVALGSGAHLTALRRTVVGDITLESATTIEQFEQQLK